MILSLVILKKNGMPIIHISAKTVISKKTNFVLTDATNQPENAIPVKKVLSFVKNGIPITSPTSAKTVISKVTDFASTDATNQPDNAISVSMGLSLVMEMIHTSAKKVVSNDMKDVMKTVAILQRENAKILPKQMGVVFKVLPDVMVICCKNATRRSGRISKTALMKAKSATQTMEDVYNRVFKL